jgi:hypothetical protein
VCDRTAGARWAELLTKYDLFHRRDEVAQCAACAEEYADLPEDLEGYVFHNSKEYRAPERDRTTPGTDADLSAKRRASGSRGGKASAARRAEKSRDASVPEPVNASTSDDLLFAGVSKPSNLLDGSASNGQHLPLAGVTPVPVVLGSNEPRTPVQPSAAVASKSEASGAGMAGAIVVVSPLPVSEPETDGQRANRLARVYADRVPISNFPAVAKIIRKALPHCTDEQITTALCKIADDELSLTTDSFRIAIYGPPKSRASPTSRVRDIANATQRLQQKLDERSQTA